MVNFNSDFVLIVKFIFSNEKVVKFIYLFIKKDSYFKAIYVKIRSNQALAVILVVRKIIKSP